MEVYFMYQGIKKLDIDKIEKYEEKVKSLKEKILNKKYSNSYKMSVKAKLIYYNKRYDYDMGAMMIFFTRGIKPKNLRKWTGRYFRFAMMLKLTVFEILIVSLQQLSYLQLVLMFLLQLFTVIIITKGFFFDKIYIHKVYGFSDLTTELTILCYFMIGLTCRIYGDSIDSKPWFLKVQLLQIYLILFTSAVNIA